MINKCITISISITQY